MVSISKEPECHVQGPFRPSVRPAVRYTCPTRGSHSTTSLECLNRQTSTASGQVVCGLLYSSTWRETIAVTVVQLLPLVRAVDIAECVFDSANRIFVRRCSAASPSSVLSCLFFLSRHTFVSIRLMRDGDLRKRNGVGRTPPQTANNRSKEATEANKQSNA